MKWAEIKRPRSEALSARSPAQNRGVPEVVTASLCLPISFLTTSTLSCAVSGGTPPHDHSRLPVSRQATAGKARKNCLAINLREEPDAIRLHRCRILRFETLRYKVLRLSPGETLHLSLYISWRNLLFTRRGRLSRLCSSSTCKPIAIARRRSRVTVSIWVMMPCQVLSLRLMTMV